MSAIFLPILLIIGALSALLVVFGRHLPDIARSFKERHEEKDLPEPIDELPVNSGAHQLTQPQKNTFGAIMAKISVVAKFVFVKIIWAVKHLWPALKFVGQMLAKLFHRVPRVSPTLFSFKRDKDVETVDFPIGAEKPNLITTTADIKVMEKNPLRYPEPMSEKLAELTQPKTPRAVMRPKRTRLSQKKTAVALEKKPVVKNIEEVKEEIQTAPEEETETIEKQPEMLMEIKKETPAPEPQRAIEIVDELSEPEIITPPEEKKISFLARGAYTLNDKTQEISDQIEQGKFGVAESALIDVLSKNPRNTEAYRLLGIVYLKRKDYEQAREVFEEALRRDPDHQGLHGPLGLCYMSVGEYGKALSMYQQAHSLDETNMEYLEQLLIISSRTDRRPLVKMTAKKILALNPNHTEAKKILERVAVR